MAQRTSTPLPPNIFLDDASGHLRHKAYNMCLALEGRAADVTQWGMLSPERCARLLGYSLREALTDAGRDKLAKDIDECTDDVQLQQLGDLLCYHLVRCFRKTREDASSSSTHSSDPAYEEEQAYLLQRTPTNHHEARIAALKRDEYRCMVTGRLDMKLVVEKRVDRQLGESLDRTDCVHIFPRAVNDDPEDKTGNTQYAASVHSMLRLFGGVVPIQDLSGPGVHRLENVLTLCASMHNAFDNLWIWFEPVEGESNVYIVKEVMPGILVPGMTTRLRFKSTDPVNLPLPDPRYLAIHAACAKVAHLSGAGEAIDRLIWDTEETSVLASDGGSARLLHHALASCGDIQVS